MRIAILLALCALALPATAGAEAKVPSVPWGNDFECVSEHPRPVVLVHGLGASAESNWAAIGPRLDQAGYCVFALTYGIDPRTRAFGSPGGIIAMERSAPELDAFVDRVRAATGAERVDLVGHSEGTVMPRYYLERLGGAAEVKRFVALTPLWRGTKLGGLALLRDLAEPFGLAGPVVGLFGAFCGSCPQFLAGSPYLDDLNADGEAVPGIEHTNIVTRYDELVIPYTSGLMRDGGTNVVLQRACPANLSEHVAVAFDPAVIRMILSTLATGEPRGAC